MTTLSFRLFVLLAALVLVAPAAGATMLLYSTDDPVVLQFASQNGAIREANQGTWGPVGNLGTGFAEPSTRVDVGTSSPFGTPSSLNSFFSFDLSGLNAALLLSGETIVSATFEIAGEYSVNQFGNNGFEALETFGIFDVATDPSLLNENIGENDAIFADLGGGTGYGTTDLAGLDGNAPAPAPGTGFSIDLNASGLLDLGAFANGSNATPYFSIGLSLISADLAGGDELLAFSALGGGGTPRGQLHIETVPEPTTGLLLAMAVFCGVGATSGRQRSSLAGKE